MVNPWKTGIGAGAIILGIYLVFTNLNEITSVIFGVIAIAFGIGLIASDK